MPCKVKYRSADYYSAGGYSPPVLGMRFLYTSFTKETVPKPGKNLCTYMSVLLGFQFQAYNKPAAMFPPLKRYRAPGAPFPLSGGGFRVHPTWAFSRSSSIRSCSESWNSASQPLRKMGFAIFPAVWWFESHFCTSDSWRNPKARRPWERT
jgi:hypothetical protein